MDNNDFTGAIPAKPSLPAKAGVHKERKRLDSRFRGNDNQTLFGSSKTL